MKTIVQLESFSSVFNQSLQRQLLKSKEFSENCNLVVLNIEELKKQYEEKSSKVPAQVGLPGVIRYWRGLNRFLENEYRDLHGDLVNIQMVIWQYALLLPFLKKHFGKIVLSLWGSDILRTTKKELYYGMRLFNRADTITYISDDMKKRLEDVFGSRYSAKLQKVDFGSEILNDIDTIEDTGVADFKRKYGIPDGKTNLVIGYNRHPQQQHPAVIESIIGSGIHPDEVFLVFPWTYGPDDAGYREQIERLICGRFDYCFLKTRLTDEEVACLRKVTDVLIQTQTTDALSSTMMETIYAGKEVITGRWLHYDELDRAGVQLRYVSSVAEVGSAVREGMTHPLSEEAKTRNQEIIREISGWDDRIRDWLDIYLAE